MARERTLKAQFFRSESVASLPFEGRLLFQSIWCQADRNGVIKYSQRLLKADTFPFDDISASDVDLLVTKMVQAGLVMRYCCGDVEYVRVINFQKYQKPHPKEPQTWPFMDDSGVVTEKPELVTAEPEQEIENSAFPSFPSSPSFPSLRKEPPNGGVGVKKQAKQAHPGFEEFYSVYPKKRDKPAAQKAWNKLKPPVEIVMQSIRQWSETDEWQKSGGQFVRNPATWLNARGWEDEVPEPSEPEDRFALLTRPMSEEEAIALEQEMGF
jgi:hypothetical protein